MFGAIMAAPLATAPTVARAPSRSTPTAVCLATVSVVIIASAASTPPFSDSSSTTRGIPSSIRSIGRGTPMRPVEQTSTSDVGRPRRCAAASHMRTASARPLAPLQTLAMPLLMMTARARPSARCSRQTGIGAPWTRLVVYTAAPLAGLSDSVRDRSLLPEGLMPQVTPAARKPRGEVTLPPSISIIASLQPGGRRRRRAPRA